MKSLCALLSCIVTCVFAATPAAASDAPLTISFGGFTHTGAAAQSGTSTGSTYSAAGVFYAPRVQRKNGSPDIGGYFDVLGFGGTSSGTTAGFGIAARTPNRAYVGAGAGTYSVTIVPPAGCPVGLAPPPGGCMPVSHSASGMGGKVFAGIRISAYGQLEVTYHMVPAANGVNSNAMSVEFGARI